MDDKNIPMIAHESMLARNERTIKRLIIALIVVTALMFASNMLWLYAWSQYDYESNETVIDLQSRSGPANFIGNNGDIYNGQNTGNNKN